jgi:hypothetical protein
LRVELLYYNKEALAGFRNSWLLARELCTCAFFTLIALFVEERFRSERFLAHANGHDNQRK